MTLVSLISIPLSSSSSSSSSLLLRKKESGYNRVPTFHTAGRRSSKKNSRKQRSRDTRVDNTAHVDIQSMSSLIAMPLEINL